MWPIWLQHNQINSVTLNKTSIISRVSHQGWAMWYILKLFVFCLPHLTTLPLLFSERTQPLPHCAHTIAVLMPWEVLPVSSSSITNSRGGFRLCCEKMAHTSILSDDERFFESFWILREYFSGDVVCQWVMHNYGLNTDDSFLCSCVW